MLFRATGRHYSAVPEEREWRSSIQNPIQHAFFQIYAELKAEYPDFDPPKHGYASLSRVSLRFQPTL